MRNADYGLGIKNEPVSEHIWSKEQLNRNIILPLHAVVFGAFRVVDTHISNSRSSAVAQTIPQSLSPKNDGYSFIDLVWGSEYKGVLAGVHRFSISHGVELKNGDEKEDSVIITFECTANSRDWAGVLGSTLMKFHILYSLWLFREGVAEVLKE